MDSKLNIIFEGTLADTFGPTHQYVARNMRELGSAFRVCIPGFSEHVLAKEKEGILYQALLIKESGAQLAIAPDELERPFGAATEIIISPVVAGSGGSALKLLGGALLIGVGIATGGTALLALGGSFFLQGISQLISPPPKTPKDKADKESSYLLSGVPDTTEQDRPVPLIYGRVFIPLDIRLSVDTTTDEQRL